MKLLSPAGNKESLKMAVYNGADEIYLGINDFNARNNIDGFCLENLKEAVDFAHVFNVKVNLAINILFNNEEMQKTLDIIVDAYNIGVDSFIIQDLGLISLVSKNFPEIEIHASTQMGIHNLEAIKALNKFGFKRIVLSRETPLNEIKRINDNTNIEIEYFAHGALCVSFSGNCYLSSYLNNASGNRGKCKQLCRLPYTLEKDNKPLKRGFLLSAKDFCMIDNLDELKTAGVDVLKIEGRARRPFYVGITTLEYRKALDKLNYNIENLKLGFNRNYTNGYFNGNGNIISSYNNHIGIYIGKVEKINHGKNFNEVIFNSTKKLSPKSTFKIFNGDIEKTTLTAYDLQEVNKNKYKLTTTHNLSINDKLHLIIDAKLEDELLKTVKKKDVDIKIFAETNKPIKAIILIDNNSLEITGEICQKAEKQPLTINDLEINFKKSDLFNAKLKIEKLDNIFITRQKLNEFRRTVFDKLYCLITEKYQRNKQKINLKTDYKVIKFEDFQIVESLKEEFKNKNIIYSPSFYNLKDIENFIIKCKQENKTAFLDTPNFALYEDIKLIEDIIKKTNISIVANNYYALKFNTNIIIGAGLNVYNNFTAEVYNKPIITAESDVSNKINFPYMTFKHCPFKNHLNANCKNCPYTEGYYYKMENGKKLKLKRKKLSNCTFYLTD